MKAARYQGADVAGAVPSRRCLLDLKATPVAAGDGSGGVLGVHDNGNPELCDRFADVPL